MIAKKDTEPFDCLALRCRSNRSKPVFKCRYTEVSIDSNKRGQPHAGKLFRKVILKALARHGTYKCMRIFISVINYCIDYLLKTFGEPRNVIFKIRDAPVVDQPLIESR